MPGYWVQIKSLETVDSGQMMPLRQGLAINPRIPGMSGIPGIGTGIWVNFQKILDWDFDLGVVL